jgi:hypothetical protein
MAKGLAIDYSKADNGSNNTDSSNIGSDSGGDRGVSAMVGAP